MKTGYLLLENGRLFEGWRVGADHEAVAELVFTTGVVGYLETLTDPVHRGQMVVQTFPVIGNYGVIPEDFEGKKATVSAYIAREICDEPSNFRCQGKLEDYLKAEGVPALVGVDTRALTRLIRNEGVMKAALLNEKPENLDEAVAKLKAAPVTITEAKAETAAPGGEGKRVVLWNFGAKKSTVDMLVQAGCQVTAVPEDTSAEAILALKPDGVVLSDGAGDPAKYEAAVAEIAKMAAAKVPMMGIGLGHGLLALSQGAKIEKLKFGHHGPVHPVKDLESGLCYLTSQNQDYAVDGESLPEGITQRFVHVNDGSCQGVEYQTIPAFSVGFQPGINGGPRDTLFLVDRFVRMMGGK